MPDVHAQPRLRILCAFSSPEYLRFYDSTMRMLADRGHHVTVAINSPLERKPARLDLIDDDRIVVAGVLPKRQDVWTPLARAVRGVLDYVLYLHPRYRETPALRTRMRRRTLPMFLRPLGRIRSMRPSRLARVVRLLQTVERAVPVSTKVRLFLERERPDAVLLSPLVEIASDQVDTVRAARAAGIPVVAGIASWDNLTSKGHIHVEPDAVLVWNEHQLREAVELHGVPPERVVITGAQVFDRWFERQPSMSRQEFCRMVGLPDDRPFILFAGSSRFVGQTKMSKNEAPLIREWIGALRASGDPLLREIAVLLRPHPFHPFPLTVADSSGMGPVAIWPREAYTAAAEESRTSLFDSLHYCHAVVGINTSAMIDAAIVRKPVLSILSPAFARMQDGTVHFRYLRRENGGFLQLARCMGEHVEQLAAVLRDQASANAEAARFVASFVRPHGMAAPCTPILADAIEQAARRGHPAQQSGAGEPRVLRVLLWPLAVAMWMTAAVRSTWRAASRPATGAAGAQAPPGTVETLGRAARLWWRWIRKWRFVPAGPELRHAARGLARGTRMARRRSARSLAAAGRSLARVPRMVVRTVRLGRYYLATLVLQRAAKDGRDV